MTATSPNSASWWRWLPRVGIALWVLGAIAIWAIWKQLQREPGELVLLGSVWLIVLGLAAHDFIRGVFGPVFTYEITRLGRKTFTHVLRVGYVVLISAVLLLMYWEWLDSVTYYRGRSLDSVPSNRLAEFAAGFFAIYMTIQAGVIAFLTPAYLAGCIADEKERKTLEFLLATDLRNHEIIFGKTAARVVFLLIFILAGLPIIALMQLFGGIDPDLLLSGTAATVILLIGLSAVSVAFSTAYKRARNAIALTFMTILSYAVMSAFLAGFFLLYNSAPPAYKTLYILNYELDCTELVDWIATLTSTFAAGNPVYVVLMLSNPFRGGTPFAPDEVGTALFYFAGFWGVVGSLSLGYAVTRLRRVALRQAYGHLGGAVPNPAGQPKARSKGDRATATTPVIPRDRSAFPPIGDDPIFWREVYVEGLSRRGWFGILITIVILSLVFLWPVLATLFIFADLIPIVNDILGLTPRDTDLVERWDNFRSTIIWWTKIATGLLTSLAMLAAAIRGAGTVSGEHDRDTWISLISAPLTSWEILRGKWLGCVLSLRKLYFVLILVWGCSLACGALHPAMLLPTVLTCMVLISAFAWIGILASITARNTLIATVRALLASLFFGGGFWLMLVLCCILPVGLMVDRSALRNLDLWSQLGFQLLAGTPPYMAGWMPIQSFSRDELGPFDLDFKDSFGPISLVMAFLFWTGFNGVMAVLSWQIFTKQCNR